MNPLIQPIRVPSGWARPAGLIETDDDTDEFLRLRRLPLDAVAEGDVALIRKFCTLWHNDAVVNQPIRANSDTFDCEIGHRLYGEAKAQVAGANAARREQQHAGRRDGDRIPPCRRAPRHAAGAAQRIEDALRGLAQPG